MHHVDTPTCHTLEIVAAISINTNPPTDSNVFGNYNYFFIYLIYVNINFTILLYPN